jgi:hypothetical protein
MNYNPNPTFLGIQYDRTLTFGAHTSKTAKKVVRSQALRHLAGTEWGYDWKTLRSTYIATARSAIEYAGPAWIPWIGEGNLEKLGIGQRYAGRKSHYRPGENYS